MKPVKVSEEPRKHVGIWIRVSTEEQVRDESPEHHERRARLYAESRGWQVKEVYQLAAVSGKSVMAHPETERMLKDIRTGRVTGLIFSKLARLARNTKELLDFSEIFRSCDADLISLQEAIDTSTPAGRLFYTMIAAMAQWEREEIAERVAASVPIRARLGKPLGGAAPFGYRWEGRELKPDPAEAPIRKRLYELFLDHRRKKTVARLMNEAGYRTRNGSLFTDTTVDRLLRDPTAKGVRRANYTKSTGDKKHWELKPEADWVLTEVEAIVETDVWEQCNAVLDERRATGRRPGKRPVHLFAGLTFCECGEKMYPPSNSPKYICRKCRRKIPIEDLEGIFQEQLREFFLSPIDLADYLAQADDVVGAKLELLDTLEVERKRLRVEMDKIQRLYVADGVSIEGFRQMYGPLEVRTKQLDDEFPRLQAEVDYLRIQQLSRDEVLSEAKDLYSRWSQLDQSEKRRIVEAVVERITIGKEDVAIELCYVPSFLSEVMVVGQRNVTGSWRPRGGIPRERSRCGSPAPDGRPHPPAAGAARPACDVRTRAVRRGAAPHGGRG
jgi:site-specific DNA recombinase